MEPYEPHIELATALAVGLLVGIEREQVHGERAGSSIGGARTYPLFALLGALSTLLAPELPWLPLVALAGVGALVAISYQADVRTSRDHGATTELAAIATFLLGVLATSRGVIEPLEARLILVAALGVVLTSLLSAKPWLQGVLKHVSREDFFASVKFLIVAVVVLPLLPDRAAGPLGAVNPRSLGILVVTISALSAAGYVAARRLGAQRGLLLGAALGGLVSSTAVTLSFAARVKADPLLGPMAAGAVTVAWMIMLGRVAVLVLLVHPPLLAALAIPLGAMILAALAGLLAVFRSGEHNAGEVTLKNPFELGGALKVTAMFALVLIATRAATEYVGEAGLYAAAALAGTTDVDAVTLSSASLASSGLAARPAAVAIAIAIGVNTVVKAGLALALGGAALGRRMALVAGLVLAGGAAGLAISSAVR